MLRFFLLLLGTFIWGLGFVGTRWTLFDYSPTWSNSLRFAFAGAISLLLLFKYYGALKDRGAMLCAVVLGLGLQLQTVGIANTTLAKSGFLTVFYAIFTPILSMLVLNARFKRSYWALVCLAVFGIALLCELKIDNFNAGDLFILAGAFCFSVHILMIDKYGQGKNAFHFNLVQCVYIGIFCCAYALIVEGPVSLAPLMHEEALTTASSLWGFIILSIFSSILAFYFQVYAQQGLAPHVVSLIFLMESIFAATFGYFLFAEKLSAMAIVGCALVLLSVALVPVLTNYKKSQAKLIKKEPT
jgi:drug/metabolite transporter (DMT)-like permease